MPGRTRPSGRPPSTRRATSSQRARRITRPSSGAGTARARTSSRTRTPPRCTRATTRTCAPRDMRAMAAGKPTRAAAARTTAVAVVPSLPTPLAAADRARPFRAWQGPAVACPAYLAWAAVAFLGSVAAAPFPDSRSEPRRCLPPQERRPCSARLYRPHPSRSTARRCSLARSDRQTREGARAATNARAAARLPSACRPR
mmetsp:Transcript_8663/g.35327  ORF Transcript_8663/g.35327 Transcript_8663/m.35327 type:complete len:200 (+) Transcript_8663:1052-1651(+)